MLKIILRVNNKICKTLKGEYVKSLAEKKIADYFYKNNIHYKYEPRIGIYARPDFWLPEYNVYVEYWGLVSKFRYEKSMRKKMAKYHRHRYMFISIYPNNLDNLDWVFRKKFEQVTGKKFPSPSPDIGKRKSSPYYKGQLRKKASANKCENCSEYFSIYKTRCPFCGQK